VVTHDDLLIYRLIQCNWAESQLLTTQAGDFKCRKEFGGHCLKSLKKELRRSEREVPALLGAARDEAAERRSQTGRAPSGKPEQLPPWLASMRAARRDPRPKTGGKGTEEILAPLKAVAEQPETCGCTPQREHSTQDAPKSAMLEVERVWEQALDTQEKDARCGSGHSRLRKDLVNLNKAVVKWIGHVEIGVLTRSKLTDRIRTSAAARHLREAHGAEFQEEAFVCQALERATVARAKIKSAKLAQTASF